MRTGKLKFVAEYCFRAGKNDIPDDQFEEVYKNALEEEAKEWRKL